MSWDLLHKVYMNYLFWGQFLQYISPLSFPSTSLLLSFGKGLQVHLGYAVGHISSRAIVEVPLDVQLCNDCPL